MKQLKLLKLLSPLIIGVLMFLILFFTFSSCISEKKRAQICSTCAVKTIVKDSVRVVIKERLQQVFITDTFNYYLPNPCANLCDSFGNLKKTFKETIVNDKGTKINLFVKNNKLEFNDMIDSLKRVISVKDTLIDRFVNTSIEVPAHCTLEHVTWWDKLFIKLGQILSLIVILFLGFKAFKFYIKFHLPV